MGPRGFVVSTSVLLLVVLALWGPRIAWQLRGSERHNVAIVDKTVRPGDDYREHAGLVWLLNHQRVVQGNAMAHPGKPFSAGGTYFGYLPDSKAKRPVRDIKLGQGEFDLVYLADAYGVYARDIERGRRDKATADASASRAPGLVYGGLESAEVAMIRAGPRDDGLLVAEFDTLGPPTSRPARAQLEQLLGVRWTGWVGRHLTDLDDAPGFFVQAWERHNKTTWRFQGSGYVLANHDGRAVVLREGEDVERSALQVRFTRAARVRWQVPAQIRYDGWFDVVAAAKDAKVQASYRIDARKPGRAALQAAKLPLEFPAVVTRSGSPDTVYLAGDWVDQPRLPDDYDHVGAPWWQALTAPRDARDDPRAFFWHVWVPIMRGLLREL